MKMFVLFIWLAGNSPVPSWGYDTLAECQRDAKPYKRAVCVEVVVPNR